MVAGKTLCNKIDNFLRVKLEEDHLAYNNPTKEKKYTSSSSIFNHDLKSKSELYAPQGPTTVVRHQ